MKQGWTRFWLSASLLLTIHAASALGTQKASTSPAKPNNRTGNETLLAGLRPGRDTLATAEKRFKTKYTLDDKESGNKEWRDECSGRAIRLELDAKSLIQSVTITTLASHEGKCGERRGEFLDAKNWISGLGLRLGDPQDRVTELYGEPNSSGPAAKNDRELELMFYQFDWAGSDVPQVMEVLCARDTGRVVEVTLAFPSL